MMHTRLNTRCTLWYDTRCFRRRPSCSYLILPLYYYYHVALQPIKAQLANSTAFFCILHFPKESRIWIVSKNPRFFRKFSGGQGFDSWVCVNHFVHRSAWMGIRHWSVMKDQQGFFLENQNQWGFLFGQLIRTFVQDILFFLRIRLPILRWL